MHDVILAGAARAGVFLAKSNVIDPGTGQPPPGHTNLATILQWVAWIVCAICVAGVLIVAGRMAVMHNRGEGGQHMVGIAYVLGACVLVGSASALVGALA